MTTRRVVTLTRCSGIPRLTSGHYFECQAGSLAPEPQDQAQNGATSARPPSKTEVGLELDHRVRPTEWWQALKELPFCENIMSISPAEDDKGHGKSTG
jgi:hypothetical protein